MPADEDDLFERIRAFGAAWDVFDREASRALGLNRSDLRALNVLEHGPRTPSSIAAALGLTSGSVTALVDRLVASGYVERRADPQDRRRVEVALTSSTYAAFAAIYRPCGQAVTDSLHGLGDRERRAASTALRLAAEAMLGAASRLGAGA